MRFLVLSDLHFATYSPAHVTAARDRVFDAIFRQIAAAGADLVFVTGDCTHRGRESELAAQQAIAYRRGLRLIRLLGNHDADTQPKLELAPYFLGPYPPASPTDLYTAFTVGTVRFVLLDTARSMISHIDYSGDISAAQQLWLAQQVALVNADPTLQYLIVLGHHPIVNTTRRSEEPGLNIANSAAVASIFAALDTPQKHGLYLCGHTHCHSIVGPDAAGWYFVQTGATLLCESYRVITIESNRIQITTADVAMDAALRDDWATVCANFEEPFSLYPRAAVSGTVTDQALTIEAAHT